MRKASNAQKRKIERLEKKKQKTVGVVRISDLKKKVQKIVNKFVRERDKDQGCISCGNQNASSYEAGHFVAQGASGFLRFNLDNIHKQCYSCNHFKHANLLEYRIALIRKIGVERVEYLEAHRHDTHSWTREELTEVVTALSSMEVEGKVV
jgi:hypothetical protein